MSTQSTSDVRDANQPLRARRLHWMNQLERHSFAQPDGIAYIFEGRELTWREFRNRAHALAGWMQDQGIDAGDRVALIMGNRIEFIEAVLATNILGAIAVPVNFRLTGPEASYILTDSGASLVVVDAIGAPVVTKALKSVSLPVLTVGGAQVGGAQDGYEPPRVSGFEDAIAQGLTPSIGDVSENDPALIMYTSGTTGRPKGAVLTHLNLQSQAMTSIRAFDHDDDERGFIASPLFHIGAIGSVIPHLVVGSTIVILPMKAFDPAEMLEMVERYGITTMFMVPTQWQAVCHHPDVHTRDLSSLRALGWGAAPASDALLRLMKERFPNARHVALFGQTEMSPVTCVLREQDARRKLGSVGRPISAVTARVVDPGMNDVAPGEVGEIVYRGPGMMRGYWNKPEETEAAFEGGWFHSGDLVRRDEEGYVYVVDRVKDMIISGGENIYSAELEKVIANHPDVVEVSIVGAPHPRWGETPVAYLVLAEGREELTIERLREWAGESLARYKLPTRLHVVSLLPRNAAGKVLKADLRRQAQE